MVDTRIILGYDPGNEDVYTGMARAQSLRDAARSSQMQEMQFQQQQEDRTLAQTRRQQFGQTLGGMVPPELAEFAKADPEGAMKLWEFKKSASAEQKAAAMEAQTVLANTASTLRNVPYEQRRQALAQMAPQLSQMGVTPEQLQGFDPTDGAIDAIIGQTLGVKGVLEWEDKRADNSRADAQFGETVRRNRATEGLTANAQGLTRRGQDITVRGQNISAANSRRTGAGGGGKTLPAGEITKLSTQAETLQSMRDLRGSFKGAFSGPGTAVGNFAARMGVPGTNGEQADWWQRLEASDNIVRNELFGASLTAGEQSAWERTTVTPSMAPARIKANLAERDRILERALNRKVNAYQAGGYNAGGVGAVLAPQQAPAQSTPARTQSAPASNSRVIEYDANGKRVR